MMPLLMSGPPSPVQGARSRGTGMVDIPGILRQASVPVNVRQLLRSGKRDLHLLSREKIDELITRAVQSIVEKCRISGIPADPGLRARIEAEPRQEYDTLRSQHDQTAKAEGDLALSKQALDTEIQDMRDDLAQQRALADGRLPVEVERAMVEKRFETLYAHFTAMDRALGTLFSSKLYSYRQIQTFLRQATVARRAAALKAGSGPALGTAALIKSAMTGKVSVNSKPAKGVAERGRRIEPFSAMDLELGRGLDVGTSTICAAARKSSGDTTINLQRNVFLDVHDDDFARKLVKYGIEYVVRGERGYVIGDAAFEFANIFEKNVRHPMKEGGISAGEPDAILILNHLVEGVLGPPRHAGEICVFSVPGDPVDDDRNFIYHRSALESVLGTLGYAPRPMLESHLIVFSELQEQEYTGVGLSCGGGMVNVCVAYKGVPTLAFSTMRGGDWIDASVATATGTPAAVVCAVKEGGMHLQAPKGRVQEAIAIYYRHYIRYSLEMMKRKLAGAENLPTFAQPIHLIIAGGTAMIPGFVEMFREEFDRMDFPIDVAEIRMARNPLQAVASGCLQAALAETRALNESSLGIAPAVLERAAIQGIPKADPEGAIHRARLQGRVTTPEGSVSGQEFRGRQN